jgi:hypothetical protein
VIAVAKLNLSDAESREWEELTEYGDIFAMNSDGYGRSARLYLCIDIGNARPPLQPQRRFSLGTHADVGEILENMQRRGVIEESGSPWSSPVVFVRKNL